MPAKEKLVREVGSWALVALAINGVIGTAVFGLPGIVAALTGPWSMLACILCAGIVLLLVLCFAEASSIFSSTGGPFVYAREAFGSVTGFAVGWLIWLARVTAFAANSNLLLSFFSYLVPVLRNPVPRAVMLTAVVAVLTAVNLRSVRQGAALGEWMAAGKMLPLFAFVAVGLFFADPGKIDWGFPLSAGSIGQAIVLYIYAYTGFEYASIPAGEALAPRRHLPVAMLSVIIAAGVLYTGVQFVCLGTLPGLANSQTAIADATARFLGPLGGQIAALVALVSISGNLSGMALVAPRLTYALAADGCLPAPLASVHAKYRTPHVSILLYAGVTLALALSGSFAGLVKISVVIRIVPYLLTAAAVPVLRRKYPEAARFRLIGGWTIPMLAIVLCLWLLFQSSWAEIGATLLALAAGLGLYAASRWWNGAQRSTTESV